MPSFPIIYYCYKMAMNNNNNTKTRRGCEKEWGEISKKCSQNQSIECDVWLCVFVGIGNGGGVGEWGGHEILCIDLH